GPLTAGWPQGAPYDVIVLEGATGMTPQAFLSQLREGGRLVCILGSDPGAKAMLYYRSGEELGGRPIFDASAALLPGFAKAPVFAFLAAFQNVAEIPQFPRKLRGFSPQGVLTHGQGAYGPFFYCDASLAGCRSRVGRGLNGVVGPL